MNQKEKDEICNARKNSGLSCKGCQYHANCDKASEKYIEKPEGLKSTPADIRPGTKQEKIYFMLKEGKTAAEIIKTKEFAAESVYIVARKHFPEAISKTIRADTKAEKEDKAIAAVKDYLQEEPKVSEKILALDRRMRALEDIEKILKALKIAKERLEDGKVIDVYKILDNIITHMEGEA